jgi:hypothetical protein
MEYDKDKVDEMALALLYLTSFQDQYCTRAWKGIVNSRARFTTHDRVMVTSHSRTGGYQKEGKLGGGFSFL